MKCKKCRKTIPDESKFCNHCGAPVEKTKFTRRADGRFTQKVTINGKPKYFYAKTEKELLKKIAEFNSIQAAGKSFHEVADEWESEVEQEVAYNTYKGYKPRAERAVDYFGNKSIKTITAPEIDNYIKQFPKSWAFKTQSAYLSVLSLIFSHAQRKGYIEYNPTTAAKLPTGLKREKRRAPTEKEIEIINNSISVDGGLLAYFILNTGLRRGEVCGLRWEDIDLKNGRFEVCRSVYWAPNQPEIKQPKTKSGIREGFISNELITLLSELKHRIKPKPSDVIFCDNNGSIYTNKRFYKMWLTYQKITGLTEVTPHILRHGYATTLKKAGVDTMTAQKLLGHAQYSTTADVYTHLGETYAEQAKKVVEKYIEKLKSCQECESAD